MAQWLSTCYTSWRIGVEISEFTWKQVGVQPTYNPSVHRHKLGIPEGSWLGGVAV